MIEYNKKLRKWQLFTHDGSRVLGTHPTYEDALRQERAIQWSKHHRKNPEGGDELRERLMMLGGHYPKDNMYKLVAETGESFYSEPLSYEEREFVEQLVERTPCDFEAKQCFHNSQYSLYTMFPYMQSIHPSWELSYIEGFVMYKDMPFPIHHGWLLLNGKVVDLTLIQEEYDTSIDEIEDRVIGTIPSDLLYVGVPVAFEDVKDMIETTSGTHTIFDDRRRTTQHIRGKYFRSNPFNAVEELTGFCSLDDDEVRENMEEFYPLSVLKPKKMIEDFLKVKGHRTYESADFVWLGEKGRMLRLMPSVVENIYPIEGNIFDDDKLCAIADAPRVYDFKIPLQCGYVAIDHKDCCEILEMHDYEDDIDYYEWNAEDAGIYFQLRDGNHRTIGALASGNDAYVFLSQVEYDSYLEWVESGRPEDHWHVKVFKYLDNNLI
jgi:hypothetical protein